MYAKSLTLKGFCNLTNAFKTKSINNGTVAIADCAFNVGTRDNPETYYATLTFWGNDANTILNNGYGKGHSMYIEGSFKLNTYINKQNTAVCKLDISVAYWRSLERKSNNNGNNMQPQNSNNGGYNNAPPQQSNNHGGFNNSAGNGYSNHQAPPNANNGGYNNNPPQQNNAGGFNSGGNGYSNRQTQPNGNNGGYSQPPQQGNNTSGFNNGRNNCYNNQPTQQNSNNGGYNNPPQNNVPSAPPTRPQNTFQQNGSMPYADESEYVTPDDDLPFNG